MKWSLDNKYSSILFIVLTFVCLYLDDIRIGFTGENADIYIDIIFLF